jgi:hypothetical protein
MEEFKYCSRDFQPYVKKVLERLSKEVADRIKAEVEIITPDKDAPGVHYHFKDPVHCIVYLNEAFLKEPEYYIIHTIVHEFAHFAVWRKDWMLHEMDAEDLLKEWGFEKESELVKYNKPMLESEGYKVGREWAKKQDNKWLVERFEEYLEEFDRGELTGSRLGGLFYDLDATSILVDMGLMEMTTESLTPEEVEEMMKSEDYIGGDSMSLDKGLVFGVMSVVKACR